MRRILTLLAAMTMMIGTAAVAKADTTVNIDCYDCTTDWYEGLWVDYGSEVTPTPVYNGWNIILKGNQGEKVIVAILDMDNLGMLVDDRVYDENDIITDWTGVTLYGQREDISEETGIKFVQTHDEDGRLNITLDMTGESGTVYHVTYVEKCQAIADVQELTFTDDQVTLYDNTASPGIRNFQVVAEIPGQVSIMVAVNSDKIEGTYTIDDVIQDFSDITWGDTQNGEYSVLKFCDVQMTVTADPEKEGAYYYDINAITKVGWAYHTVLHTNPWERPDVQVTDTMTIHSNNLRMMDYRDSWGELMFVASSPEYSINFYVYSTERTGTFTNKEIDFPYNYVWYYEDGVEKQTKGIDGEYTYTETPQGSRFLQGWLECDNGVHYILDLRYDHPEPTRVVEITTEEAILDDQRNPEGGGIILEGITENEYVLMGIYTPEIEGTYTEQNMDWETTYVIEFSDPNYPDGYMLELLDANVVVTDNHDGATYNVEATMTLQAEYDKTDIVQYIIHMTARKTGASGPEPSDELIMPISVFEDNTGVDESGWMRKSIKFQGMTADKAYKAYVNIYTDHVAGEYTLADSDSYGVYLTETESYTSHYADEANMTVTQEGNITSVKVEMMSEGEQYNFTIVYEKPEQIVANFSSIAIYDYAKPTYSISGDNDEYSINMSITSPAADGALVDGEYEIGSYSSMNNKLFWTSIYFEAGSKVNVTNGTAWNGDACVTISGNVMGTNGITYVLNLTTSVADPDNKLELTDNNATVECQFRDNERWILEGKDENVLVHMQMAKATYAGVYDMKKYAFGYDNYIKVGNDEIEITDALITVEDLGETISATGWVLGSKRNGEVYYVSVTLSGTKTAEPAAEGDADTDITVAFNEFSLESDWMWGGWILDATNAQGYSLHLISGTYWESGNLPEGTYNVTSDWEEFYRITPSTSIPGQGGGDDWGPLRAEGDKVPNGSYIADAQGNFWFIYQGTVTVSYNGENLLIEGNCVNTAGKQVKFTVDQSATSISNVAADKNETVIRIIDGQIRINSNGHTYDAQGAVVK